MATQTRTPFRSFMDDPEFYKAVRERQSPLIHQKPVPAERLNTEKPGQPQADYKPGNFDPFDDGDWRD